MTFDLIDILH